MNINITTLIQIVNLIITYHILKRVFLKPAIKSLRKKKAKAKALANLIKAQEILLLEKENKKTENLLQFQQHVHRHHQIVKKTLPVEEYDVSYKKDPLEVKKLVEEVKNLILREVPRVR